MYWRRDYKSKYRISERFLLRLQYKAGNSEDADRKDARLHAQDEVCALNIKHEKLFHSHTTHVYKYHVFFNVWAN